MPLTSGTGRKFGIVLRFINNDVIVGEETASFNPDCSSQNDWQYLSMRVAAKTAYISLRILLVYECNANVVYFDGMQLFTASGQFNLAPGGMESKQFGFDLTETRQFGNMIGQNTIVSAKIPTNMLNQFYTGGVDTSIFRSGTLTVYGDQLAAFNQAVGGTIKFMP